MPYGPMRPCLTPRCPALVQGRGGRCPQHAKEHERARGSRHARGYDAAWTRLRDAFMARPENQLCVECSAEGRVTVAQDADHVVPFMGLDDPLRLSAANLRPLCRHHHNLHTRAHSARGRTA